jgi:hypothetical protein
MPNELATTGTKTAIVAVEKYPFLTGEGLEALAVLRENLEGATLDRRDLDTIKVPSGGGQFFEVPTFEGTLPLKTIEVLQLATAIQRTYWASKDVTGSPPDCYSDDGVCGHGEPGGTCKGCPFNAFGSGRNGLGKACKESRLLLVLTKHSTLPFIVRVPPSSLKPHADYQKRLPIPYWHAITEIGLKPAKSNDGTEYSELTFKFVGGVPDSAKVGVNDLRAQFGGSFRKSASDSASDDD